MRAGPLAEEYLKSKIKDDKVKVITLSQLTRLDEEEKAHDIVIVGTVFKNQALKPNILKDLADDLGLPPQPRAPKYVSDDDDLILEDTMQRIRLRGQVDASNLVTGVVAAFRGRERENGKFEVKEFYLPKPPPQTPLPVIQGKDRYVVFISGLELADKSSPILLRACMAIEWLCGLTGAMDEQESFASTIERVIVAGNCLGESTKDREKENRARYLTKDNVAASVEGVGVLDGLLNQLANYVQVDVMAGYETIIGFCQNDLLSSLIMFSGNMTRQIRCFLNSRCILASFQVRLISKKK